MPPLVASRLLKSANIMERIANPDNFDFKTGNVKGPETQFGGPSSKFMPTAFDFT